MTKLANQVSGRRACARHWRIKRTGYSLVELLVVLSIASVAFSAVALTLHLLQRVNHQLRNEVPQSEAMMRLTLRFRDDAHGSTQFSIEASPDGSSVGRFRQLDGVEVLYQQQTSVVVRTVLRNSQQVHQERFRCADQAELIWASAGDPPSIVTLVLKRNKGRIKDAADSIQADRMDAALGIAVGQSK
jgi:prepilin-type N-terminal cleavage/methylation domain-containing protein